MTEQATRYSDDFSRKTAIQFLRLLRNSDTKLRDYKFSSSEPDKYIYKYYIPLIKHYPRGKYEYLTRLITLCDELNAAIRIYVEDMIICVEVILPKPTKTI